MRLSKLTRSILKLTASNVGKGVMVLVGTVYFTRELGPAAIAPFFLFEAASGLLSIPADFGLRGACEKRISEGEQEKALMTTAVLMKLVPLSFVVATVFLLSGFINGYLQAELATLVALQLIFKEYGLLSLAVIRGSLQVEKTAILKFLRYLVWVVAGIALLEFGYGVEGVVFGAILGSIAMLVGGIIRVPYKPGFPTMDLGRSLLSYSKYNFISYIGGYFYNWMDLLILGAFVTQPLVSAYEVAWRVTMVVMMFTNAISWSLFPHISALDAVRDDIEGIQRNVADMILVALLVSVPAFFGSIIYADEILSFVFTIESPAATIVLIVLMGEKILQSIHGVVGRSLMGIDRPNLAAKATTVAVFVNLLLNLTLIPIYGILGAATATFVSFGINTWLHAYYLNQHVPMAVPTWNVVRISATSMVMLMALTGWETIFNTNSLLALGLKIITGSVVFFSLIGLQSKLRTRLWGIVMANT